MFIAFLSRLYSDAQFFTFNRFNGSRERGILPETFHTEAARAVDAFTACTRQHGVRQCVYSKHLQDQMKVRAVPNISQQQLQLLVEPFTSALCFQVRLYISVYWAYIANWLRVFGRKQVLVIPIEKYSENRELYANKTYEFLGLGTLYYVTRVKIS